MNIINKVSEFRGCQVSRLPRVFEERPTRQIVIAGQKRREELRTEQPACGTSTYPCVFFTILTKSSRIRIW